jgi:hypothetical protein
MLRELFTLQVGPPPVRAFVLKSFKGEDPGAPHPRVRRDAAIRKEMAFMVFVFLERA